MLDIYRIGTQEADIGLYFLDFGNSLGAYCYFRFLEAIILGIESLHFWPLSLMIFLSVAGVYMTMRGIVMHSFVEVTAQTESV